MGGLIVLVSVVVPPCKARMCDRMDVIVWCEIEALQMFIAKIQDRDGLEHPFCRFMQIIVQFCKLFARVVVRLGSSRMLGGAGMSLRIMFYLGLAIAVLDTMLLLSVECCESFGSGRRWSVTTILETPMVRDFFLLVHSLLIEVRRI